MFTLLFIAMLFCMAVAYFLIRRLQEKPWTQHGILEGSQDGLTSSAPKVGLWAFLGVVTSVFLVFIGAYFMRMDMSHGGMAAGQMQGWVPLDEPAILWANTIALILASIAIQLAHGFSSSARGRVRMRRYFNAAGVLTMLFLIGQVVAWQELYATGEFGASSVSFAFFVLLTAVHGVHLVGGLVVWSRAASRIRHGLDQAELHEVAALRQSVQLCATYWHFLLVIWLALFAILLST